MGKNVAILGAGAGRVTPRPTEGKVEIVPAPQDNTVLIAGKRYRVKENPAEKIRRAAYVQSILDTYGSGYKRKRPDVNIVSEFELISQKKSLLCRSDRDYVVRAFNNIFEEVTA
jgi:hypothetical protein